VPLELIKGVKICKRLMPNMKKILWKKAIDGKKYFRLTGEFVNFDRAEIQMSGPWNIIT
jgi:hypothetical protein